METKPGYKTTEFWLTVVASIVSLLFASGIIPTDSSGDKILGSIAAILGAIGYSVSRSISKRPPAGGTGVGLLLCTILAASMLMGCTTTQNRITYQTLYGIGKATESSYMAYNDLVVAGKVDKGSLEKVGAIWTKYRAAYNAAVDAAKLNLNAPAPQDVIDLSASVIATINALKL